jgi:hypothetical protein
MYVCTWLPLDVDIHHVFHYGGVLLRPALFSQPYWQFPDKYGN